MEAEAREGPCGAWLDLGLPCFWVHWWSLEWSFPFSSVRPSHWFGDSGRRRTCAASPAARGSLPGRSHRLWWCGAGRTVLRSNLRQDPQPRCQLGSPPDRRHRGNHHTLCHSVTQNTEGVAALLRVVSPAQQPRSATSPPATPCCRPCQAPSEALRACTPGSSAAEPR